jgi:DNA-binding NarL/FixJ family response regulator
MKKARVLNVYIVSGHPLVSQQLKTVLSVDRAIRAKVASEEPNRHPGAPGVLLLDTASTTQPLEDQVRESAARHDGSRVVVICKQPIPLGGFQALQELGVHGWLDHADLAERLVPTVAAVASGMCCLPSTEFPHHSMETTDLTSREKQVFELVRLRLSNREIAERLNIRESTVKCYVKGLLAKLGATRRGIAFTFDGCA